MNIEIVFPCVFSGNTICITAHEVMADARLKILHRAYRSSCGGNSVKDELLSFFKRLFGAPVLMTLKEENPGEYINLMDDIEIQKCSFDPKRTRSTITFMLPVNLLNAYEEELKCNFEEVLRKTILKEDVQIKRCKLAITKSFFTTFFQPFLDNVVGMI